MFIKVVSSPAENEEKDDILVQTNVISHLTTLLSPQLLLLPLSFLLQAFHGHKMAGGRGGGRALSEQHSRSQSSRNPNPRPKGPDLPLHRRPSPLEPADEPHGGDGRGRGHEEARRGLTCPHPSHQHLLSLALPPPKQPCWRW